MAAASYLSVLYVEDNIADYKLLEARLKKDEDNFLNLSHALTLQEAQNKLFTYNCEVILLDLSLPDASGLEGVTFLKQHFSQIPIVVLTGNSDRNLGIKAIQQGAQDYLVKGEFTNEMLFKVCRYAIERSKIQQKLQEALSKVETLNQTLQKTLEDLSEEKRLVEKQNQQINSFINILVHDLKNPIAAISSITSLLLEKKEQMSLWQRKYLSQIAHSASMMLENIMTIVDTTQVHRNELKLSLTADNPCYTLNSSIDKFVLEAIQQNLIFDIKWKKNFPKVFFDRRSLENVMSQILSFLVRKTPPDKRILFSSQEKNDKVVVTIEARGLSIEQDELLSFYSDYRENQYTEEDNYNIPLAKKLVEAMGGEFNVRPVEKPQGLLFEFSLKIADSSFKDE